MSTEDDSQAVKSLLFFSVDIVDSAFYKTAFIEGWGKGIQTFYKEFPELYRESCNNADLSRHNALELLAPKVWKPVGDELLFYVDINEAWDSLAGKDQISPYEFVLFYTVAFIRTVKSHNQKADQILKANGRAFKVKGCAWFANVVAGKEYDHNYGNLQVQIEGSDRSHTPWTDFIGRQIDIGFRISKYSTLNRLVLSVEYCILLLRDNYLTLEDEGILLHYDGRKPVKGLLEQLGYPIVYVDMYDRFEHSEVELMGTSVKQSNLITLMRLLEEYIPKTNSVLYYPFIHERDRLFKKKPF
jgi:hypothetical protein